MASLVERLYKAQAIFKTTDSGIDFAEINGEIVAKSCTGCDELKLIADFTRRKGALFDRYYACKECSKPSRISYELNRRARKRELPNDLTVRQKEIILRHFGGGCALSGSKDFHWDHFIPLCTNEGGTTFGNMVPLRNDLNISKNDSNAFEWFHDNKKRFSLSEENFNRLIKWLAEVNGMSIEEYRAYVYECHESEATV